MMTDIPGHRKRPQEGQGLVPVDFPQGGTLGGKRPRRLSE